jgi:hypothetical protein
MKPIFIKKLCLTACASVLLFPAAAETTGDTTTQPTGDPAQKQQPASVQVSDFALFDLTKDSLTIGVSYAQTMYRTKQKNGTNPIITDNGSPNPIISLESSEKVLKSWPMSVGNAVMGWDTNTTASPFHLNYQTINSALRGQNVGTNVSGEYLGFAPMLFLKMGPLYPDSAIYVKIEGGIGPGLLKASGTEFFNATINSVGSSSPSLALYRTASFEFQVGHWYFDIFGNGFSYASNANGSLESYGGSVSYRIDL